MDYTTFEARIIALFLQGQKLPYRRMLEQCKLSLQKGELIIECPNKMATKAVWLRHTHIAQVAPRLGVKSIRFR